MPSQPDTEAAHRLNPDKFPADANEALEKERLVSGYLAHKLAVLEKKKPEQVLAEAQAASSSGSTPQIKPKAGSEQAAVQILHKKDAAYFANKNGDTFYPIEMKDKNPFSRMKEENTLYFATAEEADAKNFVAHDAEETDEEDEIQNDSDTDETDEEDDK